MLAAIVGKKLLLYGSVLSSEATPSDDLSEYKVVFEILTDEHLKTFESFGGVIICDACVTVIDSAHTDRKDYNISKDFAEMCQRQGGVVFSVDSISEDCHGTMAVCSCTPLDEYKQIMEI